MTFVFFVKELLKWLVLLSNVLIALLVIGLIPALRKLPVIKQIYAFMHGKPLLFAWIFSLVATLGSLFYSEIALYDPCRLCWYQRIFMYPLAIMLGMAWWKNEKHIVKYAIPLAVIGGLIAAYHSAIQFIAAVSPSVTDTCAAVGASCRTPEFWAFGYITIPVMALSAFILILFGLWAARK